MSPAGLLLQCASPAMFGNGSWPPQCPARDTSLVSCLPQHTLTRQSQLSKSEIFSHALLKIFLSGFTQIFFTQSENIVIYHLTQNSRDISEEHLQLWETMLAAGPYSHEILHCYWLRTGFLVSDWSSLYLQCERLVSAVQQT